MTNIEEIKQAMANVIFSNYQPIYKHPELYEKTVRVCEDRLIYIKEVYNKLSKKLGRPLNVLDLGCNLGYISLSLAEIGAKVNAVDFDSNSIKICNLLVQENPNYDITFQVNRIENVIDKLEENQYDIVLGLSVFHHLCNQYGWQAVSERINTLAEKVKVGIFELALKEENPQSNAALPDNCRDLLKGFECIRLLSYNDTHLPNIKRPLLFASSKYVLSEKLGLLLIDSCKNSWIYQRKFYFCDDFFVKYQYTKNDDDSRYYLELRKEIEFLSENKLDTGGGIQSFPKLSSVEQNEDEIWIIRDKIPGVPLGEKIENGENFDAWDIIRQTLSLMVDLEKEGFYYKDLHVYNVLINAEDKVILIDYGCIEKDRDFLYYPYDLLLLFFMYMNAVLEHKLSDVPGMKPMKFLMALKKYLPQEKIDRINQINEDEHMFATLYEIIFDGNNEGSNSQTIFDKEMLAMESHINEVYDKQNEYEQRQALVIFNLMKMGEFLNQKFGGELSVDKKLYDLLHVINEHTMIINQKNEQIAMLEQKLNGLIDHVNQLTVFMNGRFAQMEQRINELTNNVNQLSENINTKKIEKIIRRRHENI